MNTDRPVVVVVAVLVVAVVVVVVVDVVVVEAGALRIGTGNWPIGADVEVRVVTKDDDVVDPAGPTVETLEVVTVFVRVVVVEASVSNS